jgi:Tat protein translocase TatB subunit
MFGIGMQELIIIAIIALLVVGPKRLPDLAKSLGKGLSEFKKAAEDVSEGVRSSLQADDSKKEAEELKDSAAEGSQTAEKKDSEQTTPPEDAASPQTPADPSRS